MVQKYLCTPNRSMDPTFDIKYISSRFVFNLTGILIIKQIPLFLRHPVGTEKGSEDANNGRGTGKASYDIKEENNLQIEEEAEAYNKIIEKLLLDSAAEDEDDDNDDNNRVDSKIARSKRSCDVCGKSFNHYSRLRRHLLVHSTEKPHRCDQCGKRFKRKDALKSHKQGAENAGKCLKPAIMQQKKTFKETLCERLAAVGWSK